MIAALHDEIAVLKSCIGWFCWGAHVPSSTMTNWSGPLEVRRKDSHLYQKRQVTISSVFLAHSRHGRSTGSFLTLLEVLRRVRISGMKGPEFSEPTPLDFGPRTAFFGKVFDKANRNLVLDSLAVTLSGRTKEEHPSFTLTACFFL